MSLKTIKVNPIFLSGSNSSSFTAKNKTRKEKPTGISLGQSNNIKKKLIARIKNFQQNSKQPNVSNDDEQEHLNDAFGGSLQFLDNLARDKEEQKREKKNNTLKKKQSYNPQLNIATELPPELDWNTIAPLQPIVQQPMLAPQQAPIVQEPIIEPSTQWQAPPAPSYSNLKNGGTRPTYRAWLRTTQKQKPLQQPSITIREDSIKHTENIDINRTELVSPLVPSAPLAAVAPVAPYIPSLNAKRKRITKTLKYKLGKHSNGKVSVLIKNSQTRRKVQTEQALLKQKSILEIKNHLRSNNLLKVGSNAPNDVLRQLYEQSILAGQIENKAKDTLIHNYFNNEQK